MCTNYLCKGFRGGGSVGWGSFDDKRYAIEQCDAIFRIIWGRDGRGKEILKTLNIILFLIGKLTALLEYLNFLL